MEGSKSEGCLLQTAGVASRHSAMWNEDDWSLGGSQSIPERLVDMQRHLDDRPPVVPRVVVERAFHIWDKDRDGIIDLQDLIRISRHAGLRLSEDDCRRMIEEGGAKTFAAPVGASESKQFKGRLCLADVNAAVGFRKFQVPNFGSSGSSSMVKGLARRRDWQARPFQSVWIELIEHTLPGRSITAGPPAEIYTIPIGLPQEIVARVPSPPGLDMDSYRTGTLRSRGLTSRSSWGSAAARRRELSTSEGRQRKLLSDTVRRKRGRIRADGFADAGKGSDFHGTRHIANEVQRLTGLTNQSKQADEEPATDTGRLRFEAVEEQRKIEQQLRQTSAVAKRAAMIRAGLDAEKQLEARKRESWRSVQKPEFHRTFHRKTTEEDWHRKQVNIAVQMMEDNRGWTNRATAFEDNMRANDKKEREQVAAAGKPQFFAYFPSEPAVKLKSRIGIEQKDFHGASTQGSFGPGSFKPYIHRFRDELPERFVDKSQLTSAGLFQILHRPLVGVKNEELVKILDPNDGFNWNQIYKQGGPMMDKFTATGAPARGGWR